MAFINRVTTCLVLLVALSSVAVTSAKDCGENEFWYDNEVDNSKSCCLPSSPPVPLPTPTGAKCPKPSDGNSWYYHEGNDCCVPTLPNPPAPQCPSNCNLDKSSNKCHPQVPPPQPSGHKKRSTELKSRYGTLCPSGLDACPIPGLTGSEYECVDTKADLESCGGCVSTGEGQDCSLIEGAWNVGCEKGSCIIYTCAAGYKRAHDGKSCIVH